MRKNWNRRFGAWLTASLLLGAGNALAGVAEELVVASQRGNYVSPSATELASAQTLFERLFRGETGADLEAAWRQLGFDLASVDAGGERLLRLREADRRREGRGYYLFRLQGGSDTVLQAPHSFKDEGTRQIVLDLFLTSRRRGAAWNTIPRSYARAGRVVDADLAHLDNSYFTAHARAYSQVFPAGQLLQIHGFSDTKRHTRAGRGADVVVSNGTYLPAAATRKVVACLRSQLFSGARLYPVEVRELGATTNTVAAAMRESQHYGFMHLELDRARRDTLLTDPASLKRFNLCLPD